MRREVEAALKSEKEREREERRKIKELVRDLEVVYKE